MQLDDLVTLGAFKLKQYPHLSSRGRVVAISPKGDVVVRLLALVRDNEVASNEDADYQDFIVPSDAVEVIVRASKGDFFQFTPASDSEHDLREDDRGEIVRVYPDGFVDIKPHHGVSHLISFEASTHLFRLSAYTQTPHHRASANRPRLQWTSTSSCG